MAAGLVAIGLVAAPGIGLVAAGPIVALLAGAGAGGATGGLVGALIGAGMPEHEAKLSAERLEKGDILVGIAAHDDRVDTVKKAFGHTGATQVKTS